MNLGRVSHYSCLCWYSLQEWKFLYPVYSIPDNGMIPWYLHWWSSLGSGAEVWSLAFPSLGHTSSHGSHSKAAGAPGFSKSLLVSASAASFWSLFLEDLGVGSWSRSRTWIDHHGLSSVCFFSLHFKRKRLNWFQPKLTCTNHLLASLPQNLPFEPSLLTSLL